MRRQVRFLLWCVGVAVILALVGCSSTKYVGKGQYLVDDVKIRVIDNDEIGSKELVNYLRQTPNHKVLGGLKLQLATYNMSGRDSTRWYNKWLRRMGQAPVIYSQRLTDLSANQLQLALINRGYLNTSVKVDTVINRKGNKIKVFYDVVPGTPHRIGSMSYEIADSAIAAIVMRDSLRPTFQPGTLFNRDDIDAERTAITNTLRRNGYFAFTKDNIKFFADTVAGDNDIDLTMVIDSRSNPRDSVRPEPIYYIGNITFVTDFKLGETLTEAIANATDSVNYRGMTFLYGPDRWQAPEALEENTFIVPGERYNDRLVDMTYEYLMRLGMVKAVNIDMKPIGRMDGKEWLDVYIMLTRNYKQGVTFEVEGTNSEGDLGFGVGLTYQHRNLAHRSRLLTTKFRASYESISGDLSGLINNNYQEYMAEVGITFPKFAMPFLSREYKRRLKASTEVALQFNYQARPEYTRIIAGAAWRYKWMTDANRTRRILDLININYVYLPNSTNNFIDQIAPDNPLLRYSYEDHFIVNAGYTFYHTNRRTIIGPSTKHNYVQPLIYTIRANGELAGNLLYAISNLVGQHKSDGVYKIFGIQYSQYAKAEGEFSLVRNFTPRHSLAFRAGLGIAVPYGNSTAVPFEKRFYAGGANNVRGWSVRTLGPGSFDGTNKVTDFINQCGDISLILTAEYRAKLFWVMEGALFVDAGNIWTIRDYENQPGGLFRFKSFYKQIAGAYGVGLRFDFTYFLLRLDLGMKAHNPASGQEPWPLIHPNWKRDATFHFAVGYPF